MLHDANDNFGFGDMWYHGFRNNCIVEQNNMLRDSSYIRSAIFDNTRSSFMDNMALFGDYDHSIFTSLNQNISNQNISDNLPNHHYHHNNQFNSNLPQEHILSNFSAMNACMQACNDASMRNTLAFSRTNNISSSTTASHNDLPVVTTSSARYNIFPSSASPRPSPMQSKELLQAYASSYLAPESTNELNTREKCSNISSFTLNSNKWNNGIQTCQVCLAAASNGLHFGAKTCAACAAFFRRTISDQKRYTCKKSQKCGIKINDVSGYRKICRRCRMKRCLDVGMLPGNVQNKRHKRDFSYQHNEIFGNSQSEV